MNQKLTFKLAVAQQCMNNFFLTCKNRSVCILKLKPRLPRKYTVKLCLLTVFRQVGDIQKEF